MLTIDKKITYTAIGDGVSLGMSSYNLIGYSFNDYYEEALDLKDKLKEFNNEFSIQHLTIDELNDYLEDNTRASKSKLPLKQIIAKSDVLTLSIGMDEFIDYSIKNKLNEERITKYLSDYEKFIKSIRSFYEKDIIIISLYPAYDFSTSTVFDINQKLQNIALKYKCKFLDITAISLNCEYYLDSTSYYLNYKGHLAIYKALAKLI